jgi:hypothetical protein
MDGFWADDVEYTPDRVKYKAVGKFELKVLVWYAISEAGVSTPFLGFKLLMLTFILSNVCLKRSNSTRSTKKN